MSTWCLICPSYGSAESSAWNEHSGASDGRRTVAWGLPASWNYIQFMEREGTPVLGWPFMWVFLPFALLLISLIGKGIWAIAKLLREMAEVGK